DRFLNHSLTYALIEIADRAATAAGLQSSNSSTRRAALIALSEMAGGGLDPQTIAPLLDARDPEIREVAIWIVSRHADWAGALAGYFGDRLKQHGLTENERADLAQQLARFAKNPAIQELL